MKRETIADLGVFATLVAVGVLSRLAAAEFHTWHFASVMATALFAGFYFRGLGWAIAAPLSILAISDLALRPHDSWGVAAAVYGMSLFPLLFRSLLTKQTNWISRGVAVFAGALGSSVAFFLVTNFVHWQLMHDVPTLAESYVAALPFYRSSVLGDLFWSAMLFGGYAVAVSAGVVRTAAATAPAVKS